jgi:hypothetical protein
LTFLLTQETILVQTTYKLVDAFMKQRRFGVLSQMQEIAHSSLYSGQIYRGLLSERTHGAVTMSDGESERLMQERACNQRFDIICS